MAGGRLIDRVRGAQGRLGGPRAAGGAPGLPGAGDFAQIKRELHNELIESLDFEQVGNTPREELAARLRTRVRVAAATSITNESPRRSSSLSKYEAVPGSSDFKELEQTISASFSVR